MTFADVRGDAPACRPHCPEWISAEGQIDLGTAANFERFLAGLGDRRLPILVSSPGGSLEDAIAIGRLIRAKRLAVVVAHTEIASCPPKGSGCETTAGEAIASRGICLSACPYLFAGGVERYANPNAFMGVHQTKVIQTKTMVTRHYRVRYLVVNGVKHELSRVETDEKRSQSTSTEIDPPSSFTEISGYLSEMGIAPGLVGLAESAPPTELHRLTPDEARSTRLVTAWVGPRSPFEKESGDEGYVAVPVEPAPVAETTFDARGVWLATLPTPGRKLLLTADFRYSRGGGVVTARLALRDETPEARTDTAPEIRGRMFRLDLTPAAGAFLVPNPTTGDPSAVVIQRDSFCNLARNGRVVVRPFDDGTTTASNSRDLTISIAAASVVGMPALLKEACSGGAVAKLGWNP